MARSLVLGELQDTYNWLLYVNITSLKLEFDMKCYVNNNATIFSEFVDCVKLYSYCKLYNIPFILKSYKKKNG